MFGSVLWVMPSPREKMLTEMRAEAMSLGLKVRLMDKALAAKLYPWIDDYRLYVLYEKYLPTGKTLITGRAQVIRLSHDESAHEIDEENPLKRALLDKGLLNQLPESAEALTLFAGGVSFLWKERGGVGSVKSVYAFLSDSIKALTIK